MAIKGGVSFKDGQSVETSLQQLGVDTIDLYYQHMPDPNVAPEAVAELMGQLIKEGKIRHWGISNASLDYIKRADDVTKVTAVQSRFSMLARQSVALFSTLEQRHIGFVAYSPLANGFLASRTQPKFNHHDKLDFRNNMHQYTAEGLRKHRISPT